MNLRVWKTPTTIQALSHNLTFATDEEVNAILLRRYRNYDYLTPSVVANTNILKTVIDAWSDYANKLYETTIYEYDPLLNYDMKEEGEIIDEKHKGSKTASGVDITVTDTPRTERVTEEYGYGYDTDANGAPYGKTKELAPTGTDSRHTTGNAANNTTTYEDISATIFDKDIRKFNLYRRFGNLGVTKTQDLIEAERRIIIHVLEVYVEKFAVCFDISNNIAYEPFEEVTP